MTKPQRINLLSVVETTFATIALILFCWWFKTTTPVVIELMVTPMLLMRTRLSDAISSASFRRFYGLANPAIFGVVIPTFALLLFLPSIVIDFVIMVFRLIVDEHFDLQKHTNPFAFGLYFSIGSMVFLATIYVVLLGFLVSTLRTISVYRALCRNFRRTLLAIPKNWKNVCLVQNCFSVPELFPVSHATAAAKNAFAIRNYVHEVFLKTRKIYGPIADYFLNLADYMKKDKTLPVDAPGRYTPGLVIAIVWGVIWLNSAVVAIGLYVVGIGYKLCLKSTFVFFLPLFYLADSAFYARTDHQVCRAIRRSKTAPRFAAFILLSHIILPVILIYMLGLGALYSSGNGIVAAIAQYFSFHPLHVSLSTIAKIFNAALVFMSIPVAMYGLRLNQENKTERFRGIANGLRGTLIIRAFLTIYSIVYLLVLLSHYVNLEMAIGAFAYVIEIVSQIDVDWQPFPGK